jgi:predicted DNA-binding protein
MPIQSRDSAAVKPLDPISIRFTHMQVRRLQALRRRTGLAMSEIVRRALDNHLKEEGV